MFLEFISYNTHMSFFSEASSSYLHGKKPGFLESFTCKTEIETQMQRTNEWAARVGRRSRMNWEESGTDIYALRSIK